MRQQTVVLNDTCDICCLQLIQQVEHKGLVVCQELLVSSTYTVPAWYGNKVSAWRIVY